MGIELFLEHGNVIFTLRGKACYTKNTILTQGLLTVGEERGGVFRLYHYKCVRLKKDSLSSCKITKYFLPDKIYSPQMLKMQIQLSVVRGLERIWGTKENCEGMLKHAIWKGYAELKVTRRGPQNPCLEIRYERLDIRQAGAAHLWN